MHATLTTTALWGIALILAVPSCRQTDQSGPPSIMLGDSTCSECGMIVSDERFATATVIQSERGRKALIFDDFNCQMIFERKYPKIGITNRWSHDFLSTQWIETESGWFVKSSQIHSPMASGMAIFQSRADAETLSKSMDGEVFNFETAWSLSE